MANVSKFQKSDLLDKVKSREIPSQIPVTAVRKSYERMIDHCISQDTSLVGDMWACSKNGARIRAKMVLQNVFDRKTNKMEYYYVPIVHFYCSGCDKEPKVRGGDPIFSDLLMTVAF